MDLQKLAVKIFVEPPDTLPLTDFIDTFHAWIQASDGAYHDVADYSHVHTGPGIVLIGNDANISIDETQNRRGLLYSQKRRVEGSNQEKLCHILGAAIASCSKLERESLLSGKLRFDKTEFELAVNGRAVAANSADEFKALKADVAPIARELFGDTKITLARNSDPRRRLNVRVKASRPISSWS